MVSTTRREAKFENNEIRGLAIGSSDQSGTIYFVFNIPGQHITARARPLPFGVKESVTKSKPKLKLDRMTTAGPRGFQVSDELVVAHLWSFLVDALAVSPGKASSEHWMKEVVRPFIDCSPVINKTTILRAHDSQYSA
jgi:hypothetical protein